MRSRESTRGHHRGGALAPGRILTLLLWIAAPAALASQGPVGTPIGADVATAEPFDIIIRGGRVLDGTGNPWFGADIGIRQGVIAAVGDLDDAVAARDIDATGRVIAPGFIDLHSHADDARPGGLRSADPERRAAPNLVAQGVTTVVVNHDGRSPWPIAEQRHTLESNGIGPNAILLVGHGTVRGRAMGAGFRRPADTAEIAEMRSLVRQAMREGAWGLSAGLEYSPGRWSTTSEVVALVEEIAARGGVYISHQRSEGPDPMWYWPSRAAVDPPTLLDAVRETIEIGERTGATVVASHVKAKGETYWGRSAEVIALIQAARDRGVPVYADQYPYATSGTDGWTVLIPGWVFDSDPSARGRRDFRPALRAVLEEPAARADLERDIAHEIGRRGGAGRIVVFEHPDSTLVGVTLADAAEDRGVTAVEMAIVLQLEGYPGRQGGARLRGFSMSEADVEAYASRPWMATASDAGIALPDDGPVHPRFYGTFPGRIRRLAIDREVLGIEAAVRSMTSLPAQILGLRDRGLIREGMVADLVVFDPARIRDTATFFEPHSAPEGIEHVLVSGVAVVHYGHVTRALPGRVLTLPARHDTRTDG